eukprot:3581904-Rhodomonas_salina.1
MSGKDSGGRKRNILVGHSSSKDLSPTYHPVPPSASTDDHHDICRAPPSPSPSSAASSGQAFVHVRVCDVEQILRTVMSNGWTH